MKFEVDRLAMLEAAKNVAKVVPTNSPVDLLRGILVESSEDTGEVYLTATNHEVSIQQKVFASVEESGTMLVNPRLMVDMMAKMADDFAAFAADGPGLIKVTGGRSRYEIFCLDPKGYPKPIMPFPEESVIMEGIPSLAKRTVFAVSKDNSKPALQCVQIKLKNNAVHAAAVDTTRMMLIKDSAESTEEREFLLLGRSLQILASISCDDDVFEVGDIGKEVVFVRGDMIFTIRKLSTGDFMDTNAIIKHLKPAYSAVAEVSKLKDALKLMSVAALQSDVREPINLVMANGEITLRCYGSYTEANTAIPANVTKSTPDTGFYYDIPALRELFQVLSGKVKIDLDERGFMLVKTKNEVYFQSPLRGRPKKKEKPAPKAKDDKPKEKRAKGAKDMKKTNEAA